MLSISKRKAEKFRRVGGIVVAEILSVDKARL